MLRPFQISPRLSPASNRNSCSAASSSYPVSPFVSCDRFTTCLTIPQSPASNHVTMLPDDNKNGEPRSRETPESTPNRLRRTSPRRLGSMATFHSLNPFNRRRSNNTTCSGTASEENISSPLSITAAKASHTNLLCDAEPISPTMTDARVDSVTTADLSSTLQPPSKRHSYISLNDGQTSTSSLPRSRTFSNLPIPTRLRKPSQTFGPTKSNIRLPSLPVMSGSEAASKHKFSE